MIHSILRWTYILVCLLAIGPAAGWLARSLHDGAGGHACSLLVGESPARGVMIGLVVIAVAAVVGTIASRLFSLGTGLAVAGIIFGWTSWHLGTVESIIRATDGRVDLLRFAVEALALTLAATGIAHATTVAAASSQPAAASRSGSWLERALVKSADRPASGVAVAAVVIGAGAAFAAASLVCLSGLKGQCLMGAVVGGIACGLAACYVAGAAKVTLHPAAPALGMVVAAVAAPVVAKFMHGDTLLSVLYADRLMMAAKPLPVDWAAGALLGVPVGMGWAGAVLDVRAMEMEPKPGN
ncbi:MAG: hypothetical protein WCK33_02580 [Phycisphaerae bacterium]|jgi:hypothetical protein